MSMCDGYCTHTLLLEIFIGLHSVEGKILHFAIYKRGKFFVTLNNEEFSSIEHMIGYYSRIGFQTGEGILVKLTDQLIPDK